MRAFQVLRDSVETIADRLAQADDSERRLRLLQELRAVLRRLEVVSEGLVQTLRPAANDDPVVRWIERSGKRGVR